MTEQQWLSSVDPTAMLLHLTLPELYRTVTHDDGTYTINVPVPPPWLTETVVRTAQACYDSRCLDPVPAIVADALEEAGIEGVPCEACKWHGEEIREGFDAVAAVIEWGKLKKSCRTCKGTGKVVNPILAHLRSPGPHCRGCWVLDLLLGKE